MFEVQTLNCLGKYNCISLNASRYHLVRACLVVGGHVTTAGSKSSKQVWYITKCQMHDLGYKDTGKRPPLNIIVCVKVWDSEDHIGCRPVLKTYAAMGGNKWVGGGGWWPEGIFSVRRGLRHQPRYPICDDCRADQWGGAPVGGDDTSVRERKLRYTSVKPKPQ